MIYILCRICFVSISYFEEKKGNSVYSHLKIKGLYLINGKKIKEEKSSTNITNET